MCCKNCKALADKCSILQEQVRILSEKLTDLVSVGFDDKNVQCNLSLPSRSIESSTEGLIGHQDNSTETLPEENQNTEILLDTFCKPSEYPSKSLLASVPITDKNPYHVMPNYPFEQFDLVELDKSCDYQLHLDNRILAYYGEIPYRYGNIKHNTRPFTSNPYLCKILEQVKCVAPELEFNSVLVTKFRNGTDYLGYHSDNEPAIKNDSLIATISLGENRTISFKSVIPNGNTISSFSLDHGTLYFMTRESQNFFQHSIPQDTSTLPRISITLRSLNSPHKGVPESVTLKTNDITIQDKVVSCPGETVPIITEPQKSKTLYISSSMFSGLKASKLSSSTQDATVLFYRGATASRILSRLKNDPNFLSINPQSVSKIYIMCGTNNVDKILSIPLSRCSSYVSSDDVNFDGKLLESTTHEFDQIYHFLHNWNKEATVNFVNLLPRVSVARNQVINMLNNYLYTQCHSVPTANFISTEENRHLFSWNGYRKDAYYSSAGQDNVHLNQSGIVRVSKHLKYLAHN